MEGSVTCRPATIDEISTIVALAGRSLGWDSSDPNEAFFRWKHVENPAGVSPMWVATDGDDLAGFRTMMRWRFVSHGQVVDAVRAVDTATAPEHQRKGVFRLLTQTAIRQLTADDVAFVFNTPNAQSRPGYLKMGWIEAGRVSAQVAPAGLGSLPRLLRARTPARKWSDQLQAGDPIDAVASDLARWETSSTETTTDRSDSYLRWRYGFEPLHYRVLQTDEAAAIVRLRRRGSSVEAVIADVFSPSSRATREIFRLVRRLPRVDHLLTVKSAPHPAPWLPAVPGLGPILTIRALVSEPPRFDHFSLSLGDVELF
ncbi:MAG: GNAT family N-acetyltransferase [Actinomycetota bacterium]